MKLQPLSGVETGLFGSKGDRKGVFTSSFASKRGFELYKLQHPKSGYTWEKILMRNDIPERIIKDKTGRITSVNGKGKG
jgi:hypothetical protein